MFKVITEMGEYEVSTRKDTIREAHRHIKSGRKLVMIETPKGFIVSVEDLEEVENTLAKM